MKNIFRSRAFFSLDLYREYHWHVSIQEFLSRLTKSHFPVPSYLSPHPWCPQVCKSTDPISSNWNIKNNLDVLDTKEHTNRKVLCRQWGKWQNVFGTTDNWKVSLTRLKKNCVLQAVVTHINLMGIGRISERKRKHLLSETLNPKDKIGIIYCT